MKRTLQMALALALLSGTASAWADRIKDIASVAAVRSNQLIGYGLVVGLQGTGDGADVSFTAQSMKAMLSRLGVSIEGPLSDFEQGGSGGKIDIKNVAAVMITAELPGLAKPGQKSTSTSRPSAKPPACVVAICCSPACVASTARFTPWPKAL